MSSKEYARRLLSNFPGLTSEAHDKLLREELADKMLSGVKLTTADKKTIYWLLTGSTAPNTRKGRPSSKYRDIRLAIDFLSMKFQESKKVSIIIKKLGKLYGLPGLETVQAATFYKALNKGIALLEENTAQWVEAIEIGAIEDAPESLANAKKNLEWISMHREQQKH